MKKRFFTALAFLCLIALPALAATTHYGFILPIVGASQNVWGTVINLAFNNVDTAIWNASQGTVIGVNAPAASGSNIVLTNPVNNAQQIAFTGSSLNLVLPPMNAANSLVIGGTVIVMNAGSNAFAVEAQDASTVIVASLAPGQFVRLTLDTNATANGTFTVEGPYLTAVGTLALGASATTTNPSISGDITSGFYTPGAGTVAVSASGKEVMQWNPVGSAVNFISVSPAVTTTNPVLTATGGDTNIGLTLTPKGSGLVVLNGPVTISGAVTALTVTGATILNSTLAVTGVATLTGGGTSITASAGDNSTNIATTAYVDRGASGASEVLLGTATASNNTQVAFTNIPSGYDQYILRFTSVVPITDNTSLNLQLSTNNGVSYLSTGYFWSGTNTNYAATGTSSGAAGADHWALTQDTGNVSTTFGANGYANLEGLNAAVYPAFQSQASTLQIGNAGNGLLVTGGVLNGNTPVNAIRVYMNSGNINSGKFALYGVRNQ